MHRNKENGRKMLKSALKMGKQENIQKKKLIHKINVSLLKFMLHESNYLLVKHCPRSREEKKTNALCT